MNDESCLRLKQNRQDLVLDLKEVLNFSESDSTVRIPELRAEFPRDCLFSRSTRIGAPIRLDRRRSATIGG